MSWNAYASFFDGAQDAIENNPFLRRAYEFDRTPNHSDIRYVWIAVHLLIKGEDANELRARLIERGRKYLPDPRDERAINRIVGVAERMIAEGAADLSDCEIDHIEQEWYFEYLDELALAEESVLALAEESVEPQYPYTQ